LDFLFGNTSPPTSIGVTIDVMKRRAMQKVIVFFKDDFIFINSS